MFEISLISLKDDRMRGIVECEYRELFDEFCYNEE